MITVYSTPGCTHCRHTKRQMDKLGVAYKEGDLTADVAHRFGALAAPLVTDSTSGDEKKLWVGGIQMDKIIALSRNKEMAKV